MPAFRPGAAMHMADDALKLMEGRGGAAAKSSVRVAFMNIEREVLRCVQAASRSSADGTANGPPLPDDLALLSSATRSASSSLVRWLFWMRFVKQDVYEPNDRPVLQVPPSCCLAVADWHTALTAAAADGNVTAVSPGTIKAIPAAAAATVELTGQLAMAPHIPAHIAGFLRSATLDNYTQKLLGLPACAAAQVITTANNHLLRMEGQQQLGDWLKGLCVDDLACSLLEGVAAGSVDMKNQKSAFSRAAELAAQSSTAELYAAMVRLPAKQAAAAAGKGWLQLLTVHR